MTDIRNMRLLRSPLGAREETEERDAPVSQGEYESVLSRLDAVKWLPEDGIAYEVALEGINQIVGAYSGLIGREEASDSPDPAAIKSWRTAQGEWADIRRALSPTDSPGVARVRALCRKLLPELRAQRGA